MSLTPAASSGDVEATGTNSTWRKHGGPIILLSCALGIFQLPSFPGFQAIRCVCGASWFSDSFFFGDIYSGTREGDPGEWDYWHAQVK